MQAARRARRRVRTREERLELRRLLTFMDETRSEAGRRGEPPLRKVAVVAVVRNPFAGRYEPELTPMMEALKPLGLKCT